MPSGQKFVNNKNQALNYALWLLGLRSYSERELRQKLILKKFPELDIDQAIKKLKKYQLVDDLKLALNWISSRDSLRPRSEYLLTLELKKKGISQEDINQAFLKYSSDAESLNDQARARKLIEQSKKRTDKQKLALLARRGFTYEIAREILREMEYDNNT